MEKTVNFTVGNYRAQIVLSTDRDYVSFTGRFNGSSGQCQDNFRDVESEDVATVLHAWDALHLKPVPAAGTFESAVLIGAGQALDRLDGSRLDADTEGTDADDIMESDFSHMDDTINSTDIIERIEYLSNCLADIPSATPESYDPADDSHGDRSAAIAELASLKALESQASGYAPDWEYGETLIRDSYFEDYAQELAEEIGDIKKDVQWPYTCIDWAQAARELQVDYTSVEFDKITYWIR